MRIREIVRLLSAEVVCGEAELDTEVYSACSSDMMSDVLAHNDNQAVLLTGLVNPQVVRTSMMMDVHCLIFTRSKKPTPEMVKLAEENGMVVLCTAKRMYVASGVLYAAGLGREE